MTTLIDDHTILVRAEYCLILGVLAIKVLKTVVLYMILLPILTRIDTHHLQVRRTLLQLVTDVLAT